LEHNSRTALFSTAKLSIFPFTTKQNTLRFLYLPFLTNRTYFIAIMQSALYNLFSAYHRIYTLNTLSPIETLIIRCQQAKSPSDSPPRSPKGHRLGAWQSRPRHPSRARCPKTGERNDTNSGHTKPNRHTKTVAVVQKNIQPRPLSRFFLLRYRIKIIRRSQISD